MLNTGANLNLLIWVCGNAEGIKTIVIYVAPCAILTEKDIFEISSSKLHWLLKTQLLKRTLMVAKKCIMNTWIRSQPPTFNMWVQLLQPHKNVSPKLMIK